MHYIMRVSSAHNNILVIKGDQGGTALRKHHLDQEGKNVETSSKKQSVGWGGRRSASDSNYKEGAWNI